MRVEELALVEELLSLSLWPLLSLIYSLFAHKVNLRILRYILLIPILINLSQAAPPEARVLLPFLTPLEVLQHHHRLYC